MSSRTLSSGLPGTTAGPLSPPLNAAAAVDSDRFPLGAAAAVAVNAAPFQDRATLSRKNESSAPAASWFASKSDRR